MYVPVFPFPRGSAQGVFLFFTSYGYALFHSYFHIFSNEIERMSLESTKLTKKNIFYEADAIISSGIPVFPVGNNCRPVNIY